MTSLIGGECYKPRGVKVPPLSIAKIRKVALGFRTMLEANEDYLNVVDLLEHKLFQLGVDYHYCEAHELGRDIAARANPATGDILIREDVYRLACDGDGMARFTLAHELGHLTLHRPDLIGYARNLPEASNHRAYEDSEWQADCFAAEILMPAGVIIQERLSSLEIQRRFGVSAMAADYRIDNLRRHGSIK